MKRLTKLIKDEKKLYGKQITIHKTNVHSNYVSDVIAERRAKHHKKNFDTPLSIKRLRVGHMHGEVK